MPIWKKCFCEGGDLRGHSNTKIFEYRHSLVHYFTLALAVIDRRHRLIDVSCLDALGSDLTFWIFGSQPVQPPNFLPIQYKTAIKRLKCRVGIALAASLYVSK